MKHYITLLSLLIVSLGFAQKDPVAIIKSVNALKKQTIAQMQANTNKTKNDILCEKFAKEAREKLLEIEDIESSSFKPYLKKDGGFTTDFQKLLNNSGLQDAWDEGFGGFYFKKGYLAKIFKNYLSEEYLLYIRINDIRPFMYNDAALMISWDELGTLLLNESNFIKKYPNSKKLKEVKLCYADDVITFIFGIDNTPSFEIPVARKTMKAFVSKNPEALATPLVKIYLENTKVNKNGMTVYKDENKNLYDLINAELEKQLGGKISELSSEFYSQYNGD
ncbi:hypothetical protein C8P65_101357 [Capnocytophaga leadbetteri]|uniref:GLPGLI family protein n=1 Tax=Capnocytophaga leadbetteri TaxID=327575 RepID=A0A2T5XYS7_9FLAO|nr:hypothetical protein [Capnocytophaga leadbetteri]PTX08689.1 hypothetical protein C8P65_101357 [Capnocytophaga leadbetteri]